MRLPCRLAQLAVLTSVGLGAMFANAQAGLDPGLCHSTTARADIPSNFGVDACFDGTKLTLRNSTTLVLNASRTGDVGNPTRHEGDYGLAADAERRHASDPDVFLPGDELIFRVGSGAGTVSIRSSHDNGYYAIATTIADFFPLKSTAIVNAFSGLVAELNDDFAQYHSCMAKNDWLGQIGCHALLVRNVTFAAGRAAISGTAKDVVAAVLSAGTWSKWVQTTVRDAGASLHESGLIRIAAAPPSRAGTHTPPKTTSTPPPTTTPSPHPATTTPTPTGATPQSLAVGAAFASECVVAWPTAPVVTSDSIQMTMSCDAVPEDEYLFTEVVYGDPNLPITPDNSRAYVVGKIVDVATSAYGYKELIVQASSVKVQ